MRNWLIGIIAVALCAACNRDAIESPQAAANDTVLPAGTSPEPATSTETLVPIGGATGTSANTITTHTPPPDASTTTRTITGEPPRDTAPAPTAQIARGQEVFREKCASCHGRDGRTDTGGVTLASQTMQSRSAEELRQAILATTAHRTLKLDQTQLDAAVAYVRALK